MILETYIDDIGDDAHGLQITTPIKAVVEEHLENAGGKYFVTVFGKLTSTGSSIAEAVERVLHLVREFRCILKSQPDERLFPSDRKLKEQLLRHIK